MKIHLSYYQAAWPDQFEALKTELQHILRPLHPAIEHIGSTAVPGLAAKPIIDIAVGLHNADQLDIAASCFQPYSAYIYYKVFNRSMPQRRLFVRLQSDTQAAAYPAVFDTEEEIPHEAINAQRIAHVHIWVRDTPDWIRHIALRDYLIAHDIEKTAYETLKQTLAIQEWPHGMAYNQAKDTFVKALEQRALAWYQPNKTEA